MKNITSYLYHRVLALVIGASLLTSAFAADTITNSTPNTNSSTTIDNLKEMAVNTKTNGAINEAVIDILRGAKSVGGEVYQASKTAITHAVDFTMEQTPMVVKEFLHWRLAESIINMLSVIALPIVILFISRAFRKRSEDPKIPVSDTQMLFDQTGCRAFKWIARVIGIVWLVCVIHAPIMTIAKITIAPRVYLIEYVVENIKTAR